MTPENDDTKGADGAAQPPEETLDYDAELAKLNEEFDNGQQEPALDPPKEDQSEIAALRAELDAVKSVIQGNQTEDAIKSAVQAVKGDREFSISDRHLRTLVVGEVSDNPTLLKAYNNRESNPVAWSKALDAMGKEFAKDFGKKDITDTKDIEAVEASVRGQHTAGDPPKDLKPASVEKMTPVEYQKWKAEALA